MLQLANARLRAHFFTSSEGAVAGPASIFEEGSALCIRAQLELVLAFLSGNPERGAAFQAAMPPFVGACLLSGFPTHSTTTPSWHDLRAYLCALLRLCVESHSRLAPDGRRSVQYRHAALGWSGGWIGDGSGGGAERAGPDRAAPQARSETGGAGPSPQYPRRHHPDPGAGHRQRSAEPSGLRPGEGEFPRLRRQGGAAD